MSTNETDIPVHLRKTVTNRGFTHYPIIELKADENVKVYESSSINPSIWLSVQGNLHDTNDTHSKVSISMPLEQAEQLRDQLTALIDDHFTKQ